MERSCQFLHGPGECRLPHSAFPSGWPTCGLGTECLGSANWHLDDRCVLVHSSRHPRGAAAGSLRIWAPGSKTRQLSGHPLAELVWPSSLVGSSHGVHSLWELSCPCGSWDLLRANPPLVYRIHASWVCVSVWVSLLCPESHFWWAGTLLWETGVSRLLEWVKNSLAEHSGDSQRTWRKCNCHVCTERVVTPALPLSQGYWGSEGECVWRCSASITRAFWGLDLLMLRVTSSSLVAPLSLRLWSKDPLTTEIQTRWLGYLLLAFRIMPRSFPYWLRWGVCMLSCFSHIRLCVTL